MAAYLLRNARAQNGIVRIETHAIEFAAKIVINDGLRPGVQERLGGELLARHTII